MIISRHHPTTLSQSANSSNRTNLWFSKYSLINLETTKNLSQLDLEHLGTYTSLDRKGRGHDEHEDDYKSGPAGGGAQIRPHVSARISSVDLPEGSANRSNRFRSVRSGPHRASFLQCFSRDPQTKADEFQRENPRRYRVHGVS